jgi:hypothetical protein
VNTPFRRLLLALTVILGLYVGIWAQFFPFRFYESFPGFGLHWIDVDGSYNEHLIRDVGSFYLGLTAASLVAMLHRSAVPGRVAGVAWAVFGILHYGYHLMHLEGSAVDIAGNVVSLGISAALGVILVLPPRRRVTGEDSPRGASVSPETFRRTQRTSDASRDNRLPPAAGTDPSRQTNEEQNAREP